MKNLAFILLVLFTGCATLQDPQTSTGQTLLYGFNFTKYTDQGFLFTPEAYLDNYESIGLIRVVVTPRIIQSSKGQNAPGAGYKEHKQNANASNIFWVEEISTSKAIEAAYNEAVAMGADAVTNFLIEEEIVRNGWMSQRNMVVTGFAIKRK